VQLQAEQHQLFAQIVYDLACARLERVDVSHAWFSYQCCAISPRRANHTPGNDLA
jgi:hypothetical protein